MATVAVPKGLGKAGAALWRSIASQWSHDGLTPDARERRLLADACAEADMLAVLEVGLAQAISRGELVVKGSTGQPVTHPHVAECRRSRAQVAALLLKLGMDEPAGAAGGAAGAGISAAEAGRRGAYSKHYGQVYGMGGR